MKKPVKLPDPRAGADNGDALDARSHTALFAKAMRSFSSGDYREAKRIFDSAANGPTLSVNQSALMYSRMCQQRMERESPELATPEDRYNYGIGLMNAGRFTDARAHLEAAVAGAAQPHYLYALALATGRSGALDAAASALRRAVLLDPGIRGLARRDADFHVLLQVPQIKEIVVGEHTSAG